MSSDTQRIATRTRRAHAAQERARRLAARAPRQGAALAARLAQERELELELAEELLAYPRAQAPQARALATRLA